LNTYKKTILIVSSEFPPGPGGIGDHAFNLSNELVDSGYPVHVLSEFRKEFESSNYSRTSKARVHYFSRKNYFSNLRFIILYIKLLFSHPKAVVIATGSKSVMLVGIVNQIWRGKSIVILHGHEVLMGSPTMRWVLRKVLPSFSRAVAVSAFSKENSKKFIDEGKITVVPNGINSMKFDSRDKETHFQFEVDGFHLLTVGRVSDRKGQLNVVKALPSILLKYPDVVYHIVGIDNAKSTVVDWVKKLGLERHVKFHGVVSEELLKHIYDASDAFLMLSENMPDGDVEGFGIAIIEANYFGVPAIGSLGCGIEQAINNGFNGFLVDPHSTEQIVNSIALLRNDYTTLSKNSTLWAHQHKWSVIIESYKRMITAI